MIATGCESSTCVAATTYPMPPTPTIDSTRYLPSMTSPALTGSSDREGGMRMVECSFCEGVAVAERSAAQSRFGRDRS